MEDKFQAEQIVNRHTGLKAIFKGRTAYIKELRECSKHGNKYCTMKLREVYSIYTQKNNRF